MLHAQVSTHTHLALNPCNCHTLCPANFSSLPPGHSQQLVEEWATHSPAQQQAAYAAVLIACAKGTWTQLEKRLHYALELAA
jgi:hypothetical protein